MPIEINNRSEEIQEIMTQMPSGIVRWGILSMSIVFGCLLIAAFYIRYPQIMQGEVQVIASPAPVRMYSPSTGKIVRLLAQNGSQVTAGTTLAVMESSASPEAVKGLELALKAQDITLSPEKIYSYEQQNLGDMQATLGSLTKILRDYQFFIQSKGFRASQIEALKERTQIMMTLSASVEKESDLIQKEKAFAKQQKSTDSLLQKQGVTSQRDVQKSELLIIQNDLQLEKQNQSLIQQQLQKTEQTQKAAELAQNEMTNYQSLITQMMEAKQRILGEIEQWKQTHLVIAPITGTLTIFDISAENQYVRADSEWLSITPIATQYRVVATIPVKNSSKLKIGQAANITLDDIETKEFGVLKAEVAAVSLLPQSQNYRVELSLINGLETTFHKQIPPKVEMKGQVAIITEKKSLLTQLWQPLNLWQEKMK